MNRAAVNRVVGRRASHSPRATIGAQRPTGTAQGPSRRAVRRALSSRAPSACAVIRRRAPQPRVYGTSTARPPAWRRRASPRRRRRRRPRSGSSRAHPRGRHAPRAAARARAARARERPEAHPHPQPPHARSRRGRPRAAGAAPGRDPAGTASQGSSGAMASDRSSRCSASGNAPRSAARHPSSDIRYASARRASGARLSPARATARVEEIQSSSRGAGAPRAAW